MIGSRIRSFAKFFICIVIGAAFSSVIAFAWTGPIGTAPANNVSAPINVGSTDQVKSAGLSVNSLVVFGNALLSGFGAGVGRYLNFDYTAGATSGTGSTGYGIRDNAGTMEFKNSGGGWQGMLSPSSSFSQIKFSDGTTQTTVATSTQTSGSVVGRAFTETAVYQTISGTDIPLDDTVPQSNEGTQILSATITPHSASDRLRFRINIQYTMSGPNCMKVGVFRDSGANAIYATIDCPYSTDWDDHLSFDYETNASTTNATTFKIRVGTQTSVYINGRSYGRIFGGAQKSTLLVEEIAL